MGQDANYIEERVLQPLQRAVALVREADRLAATIQQRQETVKELAKGEEGLKRKHAEWQQMIETAKAKATEQRMELQALMQEDRRTREQERADHLKVQEQRKQELRDEKARIDQLKQDREQAEQQLDGLRADLSKRLQTLQGLAS